MKDVKEYEKEADKYNASQIQVLGGLEAVRKDLECISVQLVPKDYTT